MSAYPDIEEVRAIAALPDGAARNARITAAYFQLSGEVARRVAPAANWCTFAGWASRQAGVTIRHEDLQDAVRSRLRDSGRVREWGAKAARLGVDAPGLIARKLEELGPLRRASDAVARGNQKVFEEIGFEFSRFLAAVADPERATGDDLEAFCQGLRDGEPPDGQGLLRTAFRNYCSARRAGPANECAEWMLLANLQIGFHEQVRLQPEIRAAMDGAVFQPEDLVDLLMQALGKDEGAWRRVLYRLFPFFASPLRKLTRAVSEEVAAIVRGVVTEHLMSLVLGADRVRLGADLDRPNPASLEHLTNPALIELLGRIDLTPESRDGSGASDWSELPERMHFIADLFRAYHEDPRLFEAPPAVIRA